MFRVERQAEWPRRFDTLAGAILYIGMHGPLWYILEEWDGEKWKVLVDREQSRFRRALQEQPGVEDKKTYD